MTMDTAVPHRTDQNPPGATHVVIVAAKDTASNPKAQRGLQGNYIHVSNSNLAQDPGVNVATSAFNEQQQQHTDSKNGLRKNK